MKITILYIILSISFSVCYGNSTVDSLPPCILIMKQKDSLIMVNQYDYKGQRWFGMRRMLTLKESQISDRMYHFEFYDKDCQLVCTWIKGGIAGLNKVLPDTIDKTKIIIVPDKVPEKIMQLALINNAASITEYEYLGQSLYFLYKNKDKNAQKEMINIEPYYDKNGIEIIHFQRANYPAFSRAQGWRPITVKPEKLFQKGTIWYNPSKEKLK